MFDEIRRRRRKYGEDGTKEEREKENWKKGRKKGGKRRIDRNLT